MERKNKRKKGGISGVLWMSSKTRHVPTYKYNNNDRNITRNTHYNIKYLMAMIEFF